MVEYGEFIQNLDILGYKPHIKVKGRSRYSTKFGILIGILTIITIIILTIILTIDVFSRSKYTIIYNLDSKIKPNVNLNDTQIALLLLDALGNEIQDYEKIFNFNVKYWKIEIPSDFSGNTTDYSKYLPKNVIIDIPLINCSYSNFKKFQDFYIRFSKVYKSGLCLDFSSLNDTLFGKYASVDGYSFLNIYINKCVNSTKENRTNCVSPNIIDKKLSQTFLSLVNTENDIDSNNFIDPIVPFTNNQLLPISSTIFKTYVKEINSIIFQTDDGFIFENLDSRNTYRTDKIIESVDLRGSNTLFPGTFSQILFRCSGKTEIFSRTYLKVSTTFAYIGGMLQLIKLIGKVLVILWSQNNMLSYLILNTFDHQEINNILNKNETFDIKNNQDTKKKFINTNFSNLNKIVNKTELFHNNKINQPANLNFSKSIKMNPKISQIKTLKNNNFNSDEVINKKLNDWNATKIKLKENENRNYLNNNISNENKQNHDDEYFSNYVNENVNNIPNNNFSDLNNLNNINNMITK